ncbi:MAG TPA: alpha/beta fold hydrolase [Longimicrobium sp.]|nr:alpha/beta fold hydrolase [Longimicrobium sp.]
MTNADLRIIDAAPLRYLLAIPQGTDAAEPRPVLVFLHGYNEGAPTDLQTGMTLHGPLREGNPPIAGEFIVVAPQLPEQGDMWRGWDDEVRDIVLRVHAQHGGNPRRTYLTGFSYGGNGVFDIALMQPGLWAALWSVEPTRAPERDPGLPVWLSSGELTRRRQSGFTNTLRLERAGTEPFGDRICTDEGLDHVATATNAYQDERIYRWLLERQRPT